MIGSEGGSRSLSDAKSFWFCWCFQFLGTFRRQCCLLLCCWLLFWNLMFFTLYQYSLSVLLACLMCLLSKLMVGIYPIENWGAPAFFRSWSWEVPSTNTDGFAHQKNKTHEDSRSQSLHPKGDSRRNIQNSTWALSKRQGLESEAKYCQWHMRHSRETRNESSWITKPHKTSRNIAKRLQGAGTCWNTFAFAIESFLSVVEISHCCFRFLRRLQIEAEHNEHFLRPKKVLLISHLYSFVTLSFFKNG